MSGISRPGACDRPPSVRPAGRRWVCGLCLTAAVLISPAAARAQQGEPVEVVVLQVEQEMTTRDVQMQEAANWADEHGVDQSFLSSLFGQMADMIGMGLAAGPGELAAMLPPDLMNKIDLGGQFAAYKIGSELRDARTPDHEESNSTVYIAPDLFKMESEGQTMYWVPAGPGTPPSMWFQDPSSGQLKGVSLGMVDPIFGDAAQHSGLEITPLEGRPPRIIAGHQAFGYSYSYVMNLGMIPGMPIGPAGGANSPAGAQNVVEGEAWIAPDIPEGDRVAAFFANFAASFGQGGMMGGQTSVLADLTENGIPLETEETLRTYLLSQVPGSEERKLMMESVSKSTVTSISTTTITEDELFDGGPSPLDLSAQEGGPPAATPDPGAPGFPGDAGDNARRGQVECDCSCDAMRELEDLDEDDPDAMAKAMCAQQCVMQWMQCSE